jgi:large subunit ribosomal protein L9
MQVILRTNVEKLGKLGEVVKVKPGYARNYLIPKQLAMEATPANMKVFEQQRRQLQKKLDEERFQAQELAEKLQQLEIVIPVRVGEHDKLYGSVTNAHVADALARKGFEIDKKKIEMPEPIRSLGDFNVEVKLHPEVRPEVTISVVRHGEEKSSGGEQE